MDKQEFNRVFDQVRPSQEQKDRMLRRLLEPEKEVFPVKKLRKLTVIGIAAALMLITCAAAVVTGMDQRLVDYFGGGEQVEALLLPGAMPVDVAAEDNGATLHVTQVLRDRYNIVAVADFTAPEGTELNEHIFSGFRIDHEGMQFLDSEGIPMNDRIAGSYDYTTGWELLDDGDPKDNHLSLLFRLTIPAGMRAELDITSLRVAAENPQALRLGKVEVLPLYNGNWSLEIPLPQTDMGCTQQFDQVVGELDGSAVRLKEVYLSPVTLMVTLEREEKIDLTIENEKTFMRWSFALDGEHFAAANGYEPAIDRTVLTDRDGNVVPLECRDCSIGEDLRQCYYPFRLTQAADVEQLQGGTLTLRVGDSSVDIPLDGLTANT